MLLDASRPPSPSTVGCASDVPKSGPHPVCVLCTTACTFRGPVVSAVYGSLNSTGNANPPASVGWLVVWWRTTQCIWNRSRLRQCPTRTIGFLCSGYACVSPSALCDTTVFSLFSRVRPFECVRVCLCGTCCNRCLGGPITVD